MRYLSLILFAGSVLLLNSSLHAQITNLVINGSASNFTMVSGDTIHWEFDIATGATANGELWYDVNNNGTIEPATDKIRFTFTQTDGDMSGNGGPPDLDGAVNGHEVFYQRVGIAPGPYIFKFTYNSVSVIRVGTVTALSSPAHTISGTVTPPAGKSAQYILVQVHRNSNNSPDSWEGITDVSGNYAIHMNADTAGNPWSVRLADKYNPFPPSVVTPDEIPLVITGDHAGNNFSFIQAAAQVAGTVKDEFGAPFTNGGVYLSSNDTTNTFIDGNVDPSGFFQIGIMSGQLHGQTWRLQTSGNNGNITTTYLQAVVNLPVINSSDSLYRQLTVYSTNSTITGTVRMDGHIPGGSQWMIASNPDSGQATIFSDSATGNFSIPVSNKIHNYTVAAQYLPFGWNSKNVLAHPGDNGIIINISSTQSTNISYNTGWNMLSVPLRPFDNNKTSIFPSAVSSAFSYTGGGYVAQPFLQNGVGYWLKFSASGSAFLYGVTFQLETLYVSAGWNMIGALSETLATASIVPVGTVITSPFYAYNGSSYYLSTTLVPGNAYWVKVSVAGLLIAGSHNVPSTNRGRAAVLDKDMPPLPPGTDEQIPGKIPKAFALHENYPNPFNPTTDIRYEVSDIRAVTLKVYDILGQEVATLVNEQKQPGMYTASWDATNSPSGIYYYRLTAGNFTAVKKMILMK